MKKIIIVPVLIIILMLIMVPGCMQESQRTSASTPLNPPASSPISTSVTSNTTDASSGVLQSGLPLKLTEPADAAEINSDSVAVKGQTVPGATVSVNDIMGTADSQGNFDITIDLEMGPNAIDVIATDNTGIQGEVLILVNVVL